MIRLFTVFCRVVLMSAASIPVGWSNNAASIIMESRLCLVMELVG